MVSSAYLRLLIFLPAILIPACASSSPAFLMIYNHHLVKVTIIRCHSPRSICPLHRPNQCIKWECAGNYHPCNFQVLDGGNNLSNLSRNRVLPWITIFLYKNNSLDVQSLPKELPLPVFLLGYSSSLLLSAANEPLHLIICPPFTCQVPES